MHTLQQLKRKRQALIEKIAGIESLKRGKISINRPTRTRKDGTTYQAGPYYVLQVWKDGKNQPEHIPADQYPLLKEHVDNYHLLKESCEELAEVLEQITVLDASAGPGKKKPSKRRSATRSKPS